MTDKMFAKVEISGTPDLVALRSEKYVIQMAAR
jgi:hypothetical protein